MDLATAVSEFTRLETIVCTAWSVPTKLGMKYAECIHTMIEHVYAESRNKDHAWDFVHRHQKHLNRHKRPRMYQYLQVYKTALRDSVFYGRVMQTECFQQAQKLLKDR